MDLLHEQFAAWLPWMEAHHVRSIIRSAILLAVGYPIIRIAVAAVGRIIERRVSPQALLVTQKAILYTAMTVLFLLVMRELGFKLTALFGAAGIVGIAVGFASQTSLSNLISGIFLIWEEPFAVGDVVNMGELTGTVHSIDLLSVKVRTFDNKFVRIPNESLIKAQFTNITRFPIRRFDIDIGVAYKEDIRRVMDVLQDIANKNPYSLDEPAPLLICKGFGDSSVNLLLGVWFAKADFLKLRNSILIEIKERFDAEGIEIPFPHRTLYAGSATEPFPVRVVDGPTIPDPMAPPPTI